MKEKIISYQTDDNNICLYQQETYSTPFGAVFVPPPDVTSGFVAVWETSLSRQTDRSFGKEGTGQWELKEDHRKDELYFGKEKYEIGEEKEGKKYNGIGEIPEWLSKTLPPPSPEEILEQQIQEERVWRNAELSRADIELNKVQDSDPNAVGIVGDWRTYRKELRAWPESPDFPDSTKRPVAPDVQM